VKKKILERLVMVTFTSLSALSAPSYQTGSLPVLLLFSDGISYLAGSFVLRCFQHLSFETQLPSAYHWRDNWYTGGLRTPIFSY